MIKWSELTPEQRNLLVAQTVFNYQPVMCDVEGRDERYVQVYDSGETYCRKCHGRGNIGYTDGHPLAFEHQIVSPKPFTTDISMAWTILDQEKFYSYYVHCMKAKSTGLKKDQYACSLYWLAKKSTLICHCDSTGNTPQEAICLAALVSYGIEIEDA